MTSGSGKTVGTCTCSITKALSVPCTTGTVYDCICRMPAREFVRRIDQSIELLGGQPAEVHSGWADIWYRPGLWEPAGVDGTNRTYASKMNKNDIVFMRLADGTLRMYHRPVPDIAVLNTGQDTFARATPDGITTVGCLQDCIRPGLTDNSHIGPNAAPIPVMIGNVLVYMDVVHGVHNKCISDPTACKGDQKWKLTYLPYLRLLDHETGDCLYYSQEPLLLADDVWREYVEQGAWVSKLDHLDAVMFTGGQVEQIRGRNGLDDIFNVYSGVGDTAVARAEFRLREVLPPGVVADIAARPARRNLQVALPENIAFDFPGKVAGWSWSVDNDPGSRCMRIVRRLERDAYRENGARPVVGRPGFFDADAVFCAAGEARMIDGLGWVIVYKGVRWGERDAKKVTVAGLGVLLLDRENPERIFYRSSEPIEGSTCVENGWTAGSASIDPMVALREAESLIPGQVRAEVRRIYEMKPMPSDMTRWLKRKARLSEE
jgi:predicted GH43/DUF377 family glycosyl hydrolase